MKITGCRRCDGALDTSGVDPECLACGFVDYLVVGTPEPEIKERIVYRYRPRSLSKAERKQIFIEVMGEELEELKAKRAACDKAIARHNSNIAKAELFQGRILSGELDETTAPAAWEELQLEIAK